MENRETHSVTPTTNNTRQPNRNLLFGLFGLSLLWLGPILACGSFQPRDVPTATAPPAAAAQPQDNLAEGTAADSAAQSQSTPIPEAPTATQPPLPTPTFTVTPLPGTALTIGQPARVVAPNGLNMRETATSSARLILQLGTGQLVTVLDGPASADGFTWWQVEDQQGNSGWIADGDSETTWLSPSVGDPQPVGRPPQVGDRVRITMGGDAQLTIRALPGTEGPLITRANPGQEFTVVNGPQSADGYRWYQIRSDDGTILGWAADSDLQNEDRWLSPIE